MLAGGSASTAAGDAARKAVHDELTLQLPSAGGGPLASPELVRPEAPGTPGVAGDCGRSGGFGSGQARPGIAGELAGARARPRPRRPRSRCCLNPGWAVPGRPDDAAIAGGSLTYLAAVARFAAGLAARGRVLPVLESEGDGFTRAVAAGARRCRRAARP